MRLSIQHSIHNQSRSLFLSVLVGLAVITLASSSIPRKNGKNINRLPSTFVSSFINKNEGRSPVISSLTDNSNNNDEMSSIQSYYNDLFNTLRGGSDVEEDEYDDEYDEEDDDDLLDDFDLDDEAAEDDFAEDNMVDRMIQDYFKTPPLTKAYLTASFAATAYGFLFSKEGFPQFLVLQWKKVKMGQLWRPLTTFLNFGPIGLGYVLTLQFVWQYMGTLEKLHHRNPYDFWIMIFFGMLTMVLGYPVLNVSPKFLGHNLSTFLVYVWSRYHEGMEVNVFGLWNTRAEVLPWFFLAQTFLLEGEMPTLDLLGIAFGHVYYHCKTVGILRAPDRLVKWYRESDAAKGMRAKYKEISTDFEVI